MAASPLCLAGGGLRAAAESLAAEASPIARAEDALTVFDFEPVARDRLLRAHYDYLAMGVDDEFTVAANREAFRRFALRPRRLVDVREVDTRVELLGQPLACPILLAPIGSQRAYHERGEIAVAEAARQGGATPILSMGSSASLAEVASAHGAPVWSQIYAQRSWPLTRHFVRAAESAGSPVVVLTVDIAGLPTQRQRIERYRRDENPECQPCHSSLGGRLLDRIAGVGRAVGLDPEEIAASSMRIDWGVVDRIRDGTKLRLAVKGILTGEDARACVEHGVDAVVVSNHGGRAEDNGLATIAALPGVVAAVGGRIPILVDGGFRRGIDVYKALALGASAVCIGRPYVWGLAAFGREGVEAVIAILRRELETSLRQMGTPHIADVSGERVIRAD
jgi:isopentenyl diphosphate isomerase/L-lactate dehydrogenase-like FMN-dependent dehydrogenase